MVPYLSSGPSQHIKSFLLSLEVDGFDAALDDCKKYLPQFNKVNKAKKSLVYQSMAEYLITFF